MNFDFFLQKETTIKETPLEGESAHSKLAPKKREKAVRLMVENKSYKKAAVLALFYPNKKGETHFLLTERANYQGTHSAQISFPGGKYEPSDRHLEQTAIRECFEEVGVPMSQIKLLKELTAVYIPPSNFKVTPFVGIVKERPLFIPNREVAQLIEVPCKDLITAKFHIPTSDSNAQREYGSFPHFNFGEHKVWGATAMILSEIKELLKTL